MSVLIRQARVIDPSSAFHNKLADILVENGILTQIDTSLNVSADQTVSVEGVCVSPGWVDVFADYREPGYEHKETIQTGLRTAEAGGFTDVLLAPNTLPAVTSKSAVRFILQQSQRGVAKIHPLGAVTQDIEGKSLAEMLDMHAHGAIAFTDGWKPVQNANLMLKALEYVRSFDGIVVQLPLDLSLASGGLMHEGPVSTRLGMAGIPVLAETILIHRDLELLRYTGSRLHFTGVSTAAGLDMIRKAKEEGLNVTCSVTPYHLLLTDEALTSYDSLYKVTPVLRSEADRQALLAGLVDGTIDCIASHHRPQEWDSKAKEFEYAGEGMNIQEIVFPLLIEAGLSAELLIEKLALAPRKIFSLAGAPIVQGSAACLTLFHPAEQFTFKRSHSLGMNNPFLNRTLKGKVHGIINGNRLQIEQ